MNWLAILMQFLPMILEIIKKLLERERQAAVAGHDGPVLAGIKAAQASLHTDGWLTTTSVSKAYNAGAAAFGAAEARMSPPA